MLRVRPVLSAAMTLVGPIALVILGATIALALIGGESGPDDPAVPKRHRQKRRLGLEPAY